MNNLLQDQLAELLSDAPARISPQCASALRVGAGTLCRGSSGEVTATTVVCDVAGDDTDEFESLVTEIADEYGLDASIWINQQAGSASVRFTLPTPAPAESRQSAKSVFGRLLRR